MAEPRSRRTGEHNAEIVKLLADAAQMRTRLAALESRVEKLEKELASARKGTVAGARAPVVPPPLPRMSAAPPLPKSTGRKSVVDISEIAELVDSLPPPTQPSRVPRGR